MYKTHGGIGRQKNRLSVKTKRDGFSKPALLRLKASSASESSVSEYMFCLFTLQ
jgi:hypothetical protein